MTGKREIAMRARPDVSRVPPAAHAVPAEVTATPSSRRTAADLAVPKRA
jgi:hypothetical protein